MGCAAAQKLNRQWIGIDITNLAIRQGGPRGVPQVRDLRGVLEREEAEMGVLISLEEPTGPMRKEAASAGFYTSPWGKHARLQLVTIEDLLTGRTIDLPPMQTSTTFKRAPKAAPKVGERRALDFDGPEDQAF